MSTYPTPATFADAFAMRDGIVSSLYEVDPEVRASVIADMASFSKFGPDTDKGTATALRRFWLAIGEFFELDAANPDAAPGSEAWKAMRHHERAAGIALMSGDIRSVDDLMCGVVAMH
jgi:hypothetical protein